MIAADFGERLASSFVHRLAKLRTSSLRSRLSTQVRELDAQGIAIISNNCVAGILYELADLPKRSPTAGLYFGGPAYARFLEDLAADKLETWQNIDPETLRYRKCQSCWELPVASGGELVFLHYASRSEAVAKWQRRLARMRGLTPFVISSIQGGITLESLRVPLTHFRYCFTIEGNPAPDADRIMLLPAFLADLSTYIGQIFSGDAPNSADQQRFYSYD